MSTGFPWCQRRRDGPRCCSLAQFAWPENLLQDGSVTGWVITGNRWRTVDDSDRGYPKILFAWEDHFRKNTRIASRQIVDARNVCTLQKLWGEDDHETESFQRPWRPDSAGLCELSVELRELSACVLRPTVGQKQ